MEKNTPMSSKIGRFFQKILSLLLSLFFLLIGTVSLFIPWSSWIRTEVIQFILEDNLIIPLFGLGFIIAGLSLAIYSISQARQRYFYLRIGPRSIAVDETLLQRYLETYWQKQFPKYPIATHLNLKKDSIQIEAEFPATPEQSQKDLLEKVKQDLSDIFSITLGYPHEIYLTATFQNIPKE